MMAYEMIGCADQNNRTYESKYGEYNKKNGFRLSDLSKSMSKEELLNNICHENCWTLKIDIRKMTKDEIQKALGYEIEIVDDEDKNETDKNCNKSCDNDKITGNKQKYNEHYEDFCKILRNFGFM